jgi:hypothetical protein
MISCRHAGRPWPRRANSDSTWTRSPAISRAKKKFSAVRIVAIAASWPISRKLGVAAVFNTSPGELEFETQG